MEHTTVDMDLKFLSVSMDTVDKLKYTITGVRVGSRSTVSQSGGVHN